jgi:hypothetical protein
MCTNCRLKFRSMASVFRRVRKTGKSIYRLRHVCLSVSVCLFVFLSVRMEHVGSHRTDFHKILYRIFRKSVEKIPVSLKSDKNNGYFKRRRYVYLLYLAEFFIERRLFQTEVAEEIKTRILCSIISRKSWRLWDNVEKFCSNSQTDHRRQYNTGWQTHIQNM